MGIYSWVFIAAVIYFSPTFKDWLVAIGYASAGAVVLRGGMEILAGSTLSAAIAGIITSVMAVVLFSFVGSAIRWAWRRYSPPKPRRRGFED